jgi:soluble lytic murein transglycosylase-like protein
MLRLLALVGVAGAGLFFAIRAGAATMKESPESKSLDALFAKHGARYGVDPLLLKAVAMVESSLRPDAVNEADRYSVGLMQILYRPSVAGDLTSRPTNRFDIEGWSEATFAKLKEPDFNIKLGAQILAWNLRQFGYPRGIAVYNAWDQRNAPPLGPFKNQSYVDRVIANYAELSA